MWRWGESNSRPKKNIYIHLRYVDHLVWFKNAVQEMNRNTVFRSRCLGQRVGARCLCLNFLRPSELDQALARRTALRLRERKRAAGLPIELARALPVLLCSHLKCVEVWKGSTPLQRECIYRFPCRNQSPPKSALHFTFRERLISSTTLRHRRKRYWGNHVENLFST